MNDLPSSITVNLENTLLRRTRGTTTRAFDANIPDGRYEIVAETTDPSHEDINQAAQSNEQWLVEILNADDAVVTTTQLTPDLPENVVTQSASLGIYDIRGARKVRGRHAGVGSGANSIRAVRVTFIRRPDIKPPDKPTSFPSSCDLELQHPQRLVAPIVSEAIYQGARSITVVGVLSGADVEVSANCEIVGSVKCFCGDPSAAVIPMRTQLAAGDEVQVRQIADGDTGPWSEPQVTLDPADDFPVLLLRPELTPSAIVSGATLLEVSNLVSGCEVAITADGVEVGTHVGCGTVQAVDIRPSLVAGQTIRATASLGELKSAQSKTVEVSAAPTELPTPTIDNAFEGSRLVSISNLTAGAEVQLFSGDLLRADHVATQGSLLMKVDLPLAAGEQLSVLQRLGPVTSERSDPANTSACSQLAEPVASTIEIGNRLLRLTEFQRGAVIRVYVACRLVAVSGGPIVRLPSPATLGSDIQVEQTLGTCKSTRSNVDVACIRLLERDNPADLNIFPIGTTDFREGEVAGSIHYPAGDDGEEVAFNAELAAARKTPFVLLVHGQHQTAHDPNDREFEGSPSDFPNGGTTIENFRGYSYLQDQLARAGVIAVSVDLNVSIRNGEEIPERADRVADVIEYLMQGDDVISADKVDFQNVGLFGHSRGGQTTFRLALEQEMALDVDFVANLVLAPTIDSSLDAPERIIENTAVLTILPSADRDVTRKQGARYYDFATPEKFRSQAHFLDTNHNFFNREWVLDDIHSKKRDFLPARAVQLLSRDDHERLLSTYAMAFYRATLFNDDAMFPFLRNEAIPSGIPDKNVELAFSDQSALVVDDFTGDAGIATNALEQPNTLDGLDVTEFGILIGPEGESPRTDFDFTGASEGALVECSDNEGTFRMQLAEPQPIENSQISLRCAEVFDESISPTPTRFDLGVESADGARYWIPDEELGSLYRPYDRIEDDAIFDEALLEAIEREGEFSLKQEGSMGAILSTLVGRTECFRSDAGLPLAEPVVALLLRCPAGQGNVKPFAIDDIELYLRERQERV